jgi:hypothetical protein
MKLTKIALLTGAALLFGSPAAAQDAWMAQVSAQLDAVVEALDGEGLSEATEPVGGGLAEGASEDVEFALAAGSYVIVGVCDTDCSDLDLVLSGPGGELDSDLATDDTPVVTVELSRAATLNLRVNMAACSSAPCRYGVQAFRVN